MRYMKLSHVVKIEFLAHGDDLRANRAPSEGMKSISNTIACPVRHFKSASFLSVFTG